MPSSTVENYVKRLYLEQQRSADRLVPLGRLASAMGVVPGTVTTMVKALDEERLVHYEPRTGVRLTRSGEKLALDVLRRHRLVELFLVKVLGLDWSEVHEEAEVLEHAVSEKVLRRIDEVLGHPTADPHGDPIPDATGALVQRQVRTLADCEAGGEVQVARVDSEDAQFLKFADEHGLVPGSTVYVERHDPAADAVTLRAAGHPPVVVGSAAARRIHAASARPPVES
ncbi:MAG TPA: metal-dependent transcriptional regulator [Thermoanaerobaculia bacterium]|nr:metal-dependent transcriptional regulator [Thermoanaerobaculia bacterium]